MAKFNIIAEYDDFLVVDKKSPLDFHDDNGVNGLFTSVKQWLIVNDTRSPNSTERVIYPLHRLDKLTTGLVIFAKNKQAAAAFGQMFERREINKFYLAVSDTKPKKKQGWVKGDMVKSRRGSYKLLRSTQNPAITQFKSAALPGGHRLFLLKPHSGKTHQLRVALKSLGSAIVGDPIYHQACEDKQTKSNRLYLHAWQIEFEYQGQNYCFKADDLTGDWFNCNEAQELRLQWASAQEQF